MNDLKFFSNIEALYLYFLATPIVSRKRRVAKEALMMIMKNRLLKRYKKGLGSDTNSTANDSKASPKNKPEVNPKEIAVIFDVPVEIRAAIQVISFPELHFNSSVFDLHYHFNQILKWYLESESKSTRYLTLPKKYPPTQGDVSSC